MRKWVCFALALVLLCGMATFAAAEQSRTYQLGDKMDDFTATLSDGSQVSLYGLLEEKKAVLINFWASWCGPCKREFPAMAQAYEETADDIGIIALSCEKTDTDEIVLALKQELGVESLPMGLDVGLASRFTLEGYPTSVMVDRNGVICFIEAGSIPDTNKFLRLFSVFTAEGYAEPVLLNEIPAVKPVAEQPAADALAKALQIADERIAVEPLTDASVWPFVPSEDASCVQASNGNEMETTATLTLSVTAEAGEALQYDYALSCPAVLDSLTVSVDGEPLRYDGGELDWKSGAVPFASAGAHTVTFTFERTLSTVRETSARLRNVKVLSGEEAAALEAQAVQYPKTLSGTDCDIELVGGESKDVLINEVSAQTGANASTVMLVPEGELTLRVRIGTDVDETVAYIGDAKQGVLLANLPYDEQGFLYHTTALSMAGGNASPYNAYVVSSSAVDRENAFTKSFMCFAAEADVDEYLNMIVQMAAAYGVTDYQVTWEYADGSPKQTAPAEKTSVALPEGMAEYRILVVDEAGAPVAGAMVQICDEGTCQVAVTAEDGTVTHVAVPYPYEIHLLKAPDGFASDAQTYALPEEGGEITITLKRQ